jgi:hypothetical protein
MFRDESRATGRVNPYRASAGRDLDEFLHANLFASEINGNVPAYSIDARESSRIVAQLKRKYGRKVVVGITASRPPKYFARLETDPSTSVEALAESEALAICRLAAVLTMPR